VSGKGNGEVKALRITSRAAAYGKFPPKIKRGKFSVRAPGAVRAAHGRRGFDPPLPFDDRLSLPIYPTRSSIDVSTNVEQHFERSAGAVELIAV
jgi:hypothetical protein